MIRKFLIRYVSLGYALHFFAILAYMAGIFILSSMKMPSLGRSFFWDMATNLAHVPLYLGLSIPVGLFFRKLFRVGEGEGTMLGWAFATLLVIAFFGASDEYHQSFTGRDMSFMDLVSDVIGGLIGVQVLGFLLDRRPGPATFWLSGMFLACLAVFFVWLGLT